MKLIKIWQDKPEWDDIVIESDDLGILYDSTPPLCGFQSSFETDSDKYKEQLLLLNNIAGSVRKLIEISKE